MPWQDVLVGLPLSGTAEMGAILRILAARGVPLMQVIAVEF
jgi:hypothetical protein